MKIVLLGSQSDREIDQVLMRVADDFDIRTGEDELLADIGEMLDKPYIAAIFDGYVDFGDDGELSVGRTYVG